MKRLILIRHAKSSWDAPFDDHARTLNERGRTSATAIGVWLNEHGYVPDTIYCSDAARTRETTDRIVPAFTLSPAIILRENLYHGTPATLLKTLQNADGNTIALVAHNPGIAIFAEEILQDAPDHSSFFAYPTGATLVCDFPIQDWSEALPRSGQAIDFVVPRDLD